MEQLAKLPGRQPAADLLSLFPEAAQITQQIDVGPQYEQGQIINRDLGWVELFTVLAIALIVGVRFRSVLAPVAALACAGAAYVLATRIVAWGAQRTGIAVPQDADPVLVVLLLGVTTDYCVFFLAGMRSRLAEGAGRLQAVRDSTARSAPIVLTAGLIVAAGTGALVVARGGLLRAFGPGLAVTVLVAMVVSLTLMPALLGVFGGVMFRGTAADDRPTAAGFRLARLAASKPVALLVAAGCVAGLVLAASGARGLGLGSPLDYLTVGFGKPGISEHLRHKLFSPCNLQKALVVSDILDNPVLQFTEVTLAFVIFRRHRRRLWLGRRSCRPQRLQLPLKRRSRSRGGQ